MVSSGIISRIFLALVTVVVCAVCSFGDYFMFIATSAFSLVLILQFGAEAMEQLGMNLFPEV